MIKDQKSVTHESKQKLDAVLLPEKPKSQNQTGLVVPATPQHLLPYTQNNGIEQTHQSKKSYYKILPFYGNSTIVSVSKKLIIRGE